MPSPTPKRQKRSLGLAIIGLLSATTYANTALLIIEVQNCFLPGGSLTVTNGNKVIPVINNIRQKFINEFTLTVLSQDWHCKDHVSFASQHEGYYPLDNILLQYNENGTLCTENNTAVCKVLHSLNQTLWPDHCVINTTGADFSQVLHRESDDIIVQKGYHCDIDSYSAFYDNGGFSKTELEDILNANRITTVVVTGLALDFCVYHTSKDARKLGFEVYTVMDASRPVIPDNVPHVVQDLKSLGVHVVNSPDLDILVSTATVTVSSKFCTLFLLLFVYGMTSAAGDSVGTNN